MSTAADRYEEYKRQLQEPQAQGSAASRYDQYKTLYHNGYPGSYTAEPEPDTFSNLGGDYGGRVDLMGGRVESSSPPPPEPAPEPPPEPEQRGLFDRFGDYVRGLTNTRSEVVSPRVPERPYDENALRRTTTEALNPDMLSIDPRRLDVTNLYAQEQEQPKTYVQDPFMETAAYGLQGLTEPIRSLGRSLGVEDVANTPQLHEPTYISPTAARIAEASGRLAAEIPGIAGSYATGGRLAAGALERLAPRANELVREGVRGAGAGIAYGVSGEGMDAAYDTRQDGPQSITDRLKNVAMDTTFGAAGDMGASALGRALKGAAGQLRRPPEPPITPPPPPQQLDFVAWPPRAPEGRAPFEPPTATDAPELDANQWRERLAGTRPAPDDAVNMAARSDFNQPPPQAGPTRARVERRTNPWQQKYEALVAEAQRRGTAPGREYEDLQNLWSQMAGPQDPGLDELIRLAYDTPRRTASPGMAGMARASQRLRDAAGVGMPVRPAEAAPEPMRPIPDIPEGSVRATELRSEPIGTMRARRPGEAPPPAPENPNVQSFRDFYRGASRPEDQAPTLPRELGGARPRYNRGQEQFTITFASDVDKALYIVGNNRVDRRSGRVVHSARHDDYMTFLRGVFPGMDDQAIRGMGQDMRESMRGHSDIALADRTDEIIVPDSGAWRQSRESAQPQPQAGDIGAVIRALNSGGQNEPLHVYTANGTRLSAQRLAFGRVVGRPGERPTELALEDGSTMPLSAVERVEQGGQTLYDATAHREIRAGQNEQSAGRYGPPGDGRMKNSDLMQNADASVGDVDKAFADVMRRDAKGDYLPIKDAQSAVTGGKLVQALIARGDRAMAADVLERLDKGLTAAGRHMQAAKLFGLMDNLTAEIRATRLKQRSTGDKNAKLTADELDSVTKGSEGYRYSEAMRDDAASISRAVRQLQQGGEVDGKDLTNLQKLLHGTQQAIEKMGPAAPKEDPAWLKALEKQYIEAKARMKARRGDLNSLPVDQLKDAAIAASYHLGQGAVRFADFAKAMIDDIGEAVRPHLDELYVDASEARRRRERRKMEGWEKALNTAIRREKLSDTEANALRRMAHDFVQVSNDERMKALGELQDAFYGIVKPTLLEKASSWQNVDLLLNVGTLARNMYSTFVMMGQESIVKGMALPVDWAYSTLTGQQRQIIWNTHKSGEFFKNFVVGGKMGWKGQSPDGFSSSFELRGLKFDQSSWIIKNTYGYLEKALGASIKSFDYANAMFAVNKAMGETATGAVLHEAKAAGRKLSGKELKEAVQDYVSEYHDNLMDMHKRQGELITFQDDNSFSRAAVTAKGLLNAGKGWGMGDVLMKYAKTPANLLLRAIDYSPLGSIRAGHLMYNLAMDTERVTAGEITRKDFLMQVGRTILGSAGTAMAIELSDLGLLRGAASSDEKVENQKTSEGMGPYTINVSGVSRYVMGGLSKEAAKPQQGDLITNYSWLLPSAGTLGIVATARQTSKEGKGLMEQLDRAATAFMDMSYLQGIHRVLDTNQEQGVLDKALNLVAGTPATFVPLSATARSVRRVIDPEKRNIDSKNPLKGAVDQIQNVVPGLSDRTLNMPWGEQSLPAKRGFLGEHRKYYEGGLGEGLVQASGILGGETSRRNLSGASQRLGQLYEQTGNPKVLPSRQDKSITINKQKVDLSEPEYNRLLDLTGANTERIYAKASDEGSPQARIDRAARLLSLARDQARNRVTVEGGIRRKANEQRIQERNKYK